MLHIAIGVAVYFFVGCIVLLVGKQIAPSLSPDHEEISDFMAAVIFWGWPIMVPVFLATAVIGISLWAAYEILCVAPRRITRGEWVFPFSDYRSDPEE